MDQHLDAFMITGGDDGVDDDGVEAVEVEVSSCRP
jgi:hypothetical protein